MIKELDIPVHMLVAEKDEVCSLKQAEWTRDEIGADAVEFITYPDYHHMSFFEDTGYYWDLFRILSPHLPPKESETIVEQHTDL